MTVSDNTFHPRSVHGEQVDATVTGLQVPYVYVVLRVSSQLLSSVLVIVQPPWGHPWGRPWGHPSVRPSVRPSGSPRHQHPLFLASTLKPTLVVRPCVRCRFTGEHDLGQQGNFIVDFRFAFLFACLIGFLIAFIVAFNVAFIVVFLHRRLHRVLPRQRPTSQWRGLLTLPSSGSHRDHPYLLHGCAVHLGHHDGGSVLVVDNHIIHTCTTHTSGPH
jgi:hypothetical protein